MMLLEYLWKSAACMGAFLLFYQFLLEKENMHVFKRFFLLVAIVLSLTIPTLVFTEYIEVPVEITSTPIENIDSRVAFVPAKAEVSDIDVINRDLILLSIYILGVIGFGLRFIKHLFQIGYRIKTNPKRRLHFFTQVLLLEKMPPHTFFNYIFLNKKEVEKKNIPKEVLLHEETHAKQLHSIDVLFIELLQVIFWFNPLIYLFKKNIKLNHEFLADSAVLKEDVPSTTYQNTLLSYLSAASEYNYQSVNVANAINYSSTRLTVLGRTFEFGSTVGQVKKRFTIMKTQTSKQSKVIKSLLVFPVIAVLLFGFSETKVVEKPIETKHYVSGYENPKQTTREEIITFNHLAKNYNAIPIEKRVIPLDELKVLESIYKKMTQTQKENAQPFPECLPKNQSMTQSEYVHNMIEKQAAFYFNEKKISGAEALQIIDQEYVNIFTPNRENGGNKVYLTTETLEEFIKNKQQKNATKQQVAEYNALAKKYNKMLSEKHFTIQMKDVERLKYLYNLMSDKQREDAEPFPDFPNPPPPPEAPELPKNISGEQYASNKIDSVIRTQDPYDNLNTLAIYLPPPPNQLKTNQKENTQTGFIEVDGQTLFYTSKEGKITYYNRWGQKVNRNGNIIDSEQTHAEDVIEEQVISKVYKDDKVVAEFNTKNISTSIPLPPSPPDPLDHIVGMAKKGAHFYYKGKKISSDRAIELIKENSHLSIITKKKNDDPPVVKIRKNL
jgi:hypothetical protein